MVCTFFCVKPIPKNHIFPIFSALFVYQSRKVDTKNIIFRFSFSKVDMSHIFAEYIFSKVDTRDIFSRFLFLKVDIYPASAEKSCVGRRLSVWPVLAGNAERRHSPESFFAFFTFLYELGFLAQYAL